MDEADLETGWIERSQNGDHEAFANLIRIHQRMIHAVTYRMTGSVADAEDLSQETFIRAFHQMTGYRGEAKFSSWLCRVAVNACLNWRQREKRRAQLHRQASEDPTQAVTVSPDSGRGEAAHRLQVVLNRLPAKQRAAVILTICEGLSHAEAAKALGCSETTVSWRVFSAKRKLRRWLTTGKVAHE